MKCPNCKKEIEQQDLREDLETCYYCVKPLNPRQSRINRAMSIGTPDQIAKIERESALYEKYKTVNKKKEPTTITVEKALSKFVEDNINTNQEDVIEIDIKIVGKIFVYIYKSIVLKEKGKEAVFNKEIKKNIEDFIEWMYYGNKKQSLYIYSTHGTGKSTLLKAAVYLDRYLKQYHKWNRVYKICEVDEFMTNVRIKGIKMLDQFSDGYWFIDDIQERHLTIKYFGDEMRIIDDILYKLHQRSKRGFHTVVTSNITPSELKKVLEPRLYKRFKEQYKSINFKNIDNRI